MMKYVTVKNIRIGGGAPVSVQTMTNTDTRNVKETLTQIERAFHAGAEIVRVAVPDFGAVPAFKEIAANAATPVIADIQYDHKLAIAAIEAGAHKIRINPANTPRTGLKDVAACAKEHKIPIRIGVNQGSMPKGTTPDTLAFAAADGAKVFEDFGFTDLVLAVKSSDVRTTVLACRALRAISDYPIHIGLTESGTAAYGGVKSAVAIGSLLLDGIGDTVRVSLAGEPEAEAIYGRKILRAAGLDRAFTEVVACPTCARTEISVETIASALEERTAASRKAVKIAVMGCAVNGIGESKGADFGVCGGKEKSILFQNGERLKTVANDDILKELLSLLEAYDG